MCYANYISSLKIFTLFFLFFFISIPFTNTYSFQQIQWGKFANNPVRDLYKNAVELDKSDYQLLLFHYDKVNFDQWRDKYKLYGLNKYFDRYNYSRANEFELRRILPLIKKDIEEKQNNLAKIKYFLIKLSGKLGNYSFEKKGFPFQEYFKEEIYKTIPVAINNWMPKRLIGQHNIFYYDSAVFPTIIDMAENDAELLAKNNPNRNIDVHIIVYNLQSTQSGTSYVYQRNLKTNGIASIIFNNGQVISVGPDRNGWNNRLVFLIQKLRSLYENWRLNYCKNINSSMSTNVTAYGTEDIKQIKAINDQLNLGNVISMAYKWPYKEEFLSNKSELEQLNKTYREIHNKRIENLSQCTGTLFYNIIFPNKTKNFSIKFKSYDNSTKTFSAIYSESESNYTQEIKGIIGADELSPFIELNKIYGRYDYFLRMYDDNKYYGSFNNRPLGIIELIFK